MWHYYAIEAWSVVSHILVFSDTGSNGSPLGGIGDSRITNNVTIGIPRGVQQLRKLSKPTNYDHARCACATPKLHAFSKGTYSQVFTPT